MLLIVIIIHLINYYISWYLNYSINPLHLRKKLFDIMKSLHIGFYEFYVIKIKREKIIVDSCHCWLVFSHPRSSEYIPSFKLECMTFHDVRTFEGSLFLLEHY